MEEKHLVLNKRTSWYVINVKAHTNQTPSHYANAIDTIEAQDPLVEMERRQNRFISIRSVRHSPTMVRPNVPQWVVLNIVAYTMIDANAFYNRRSKEDVQMPWDEDVVANKKETELIFIPSVHKFAVKKTTDITLNYILQYLEGAFNAIEPGEFDIDVVKDHDMLDRIMNAEKLLSLSAHVSFSNPGHASDFIGLLDTKLRETNPTSVDIDLRGTEDRPLNRDEDGLIQALVQLSEENGNVQALIQNGSITGREKIDTNDHPFILKIPQIVRDIYSTVWNELMTRYNNH